MTLARLAQLLRSRRIGVAEVLDTVTQQIEDVNPSINAFIDRYDDECRGRVAESQLRIDRGEPRPLEGMPLTIKDSIDIQGTATRCGSLLYRDQIATEDATCVRLLRKAGALIMGKTNCPEFLMNYETDNHFVGATHNPWDLARSAGGSSGGEAAAIATFASFGGVGSDGGGSIRFPAHCCGIAGLKPTPGRVPATGHIPRIAHPGGLLGVIGPMARTVEDVDTLFRVLAVYDPADPFSTPMPQRDVQLDGVRLGILESWPGVPVQQEVASVFAAALAQIGRSGFRLSRFALPETIQCAPELWWFFFGRIHSRRTKASLEGKEQDLHWTGTELLSRALKEAEPTVPQVLDKLEERDRLRAILLRQMGDSQLLLLPAAGVTAFATGTREWIVNGGTIDLFQAMAPLTPFNLFGMPALTIPWGIAANGLPCGIQLVGRPYDEELLLAVGRRLEAARGPFPTPPGFSDPFHTA